MSGLENRHESLGRAHTTRHDVMNSPLIGLLCDYILRSFYHHRKKFSLNSLCSDIAHYIQKNYIANNHDQNGFCL